MHFSVVDMDQPRKRHLDAADVNDIKFVKLEYGKQKHELKSVPYDPRPVPLQCTSAEVITRVSSANVAMLHVLPDTVALPQSYVQQLPLIPRAAQVQIKHQLK